MKLASWDAFPKVDDAFLARTASGAWTSVVLAVLLATLAVSETARFLAVHHEYAFVVDGQVRETVPIALDVTVAMKCEYVTLDVYDTSGTSLHVGNTVQRVPVRFSTDGVYKHGIQPASTQPRDDPLSSLRTVKLPPAVAVPVEDSDACRMSGAFTVNKVAGNVHVTALGHAYGGLHVPHDALNFTHRVDAFTFAADDAPIAAVELANPLARSYEVSTTNFEMYQYFLSVVPTSLAGLRYPVATNQYAVTDHKKKLATGPDGQLDGIPGIFFRYTFEPIAVQITSGGSESLARFLVRMAGIVGGVYVCAGMVHSLVHTALAVLSDRRKRSVRI
ncbi:hypothetical protein H9P43_009210 [Blastocladiella emersonii ATCC 22665]|nr:hypothetical protein H9P43_009210 [Blastocladiella emersonii ATCC 22665]